MAGSLSGYAAVYNVETSIADLFREAIKPGAFAAAIGGRDDVRALYNHDPNFVLGRTKSGTLKLSEDARGLRYDVTLPDTTWVKDLHTSIARGDISQSSFGFRVLQERWSTDRVPLRELLELEVFDISPVTFAAYATTTVSARADDIELAGAGSEKRSATVESGDALRRLRLLKAARSTCTSCRWDTAAYLVGTRSSGRMRFSEVCFACSERGLLDRQIRRLRGDDGSAQARQLALREREWQLFQRH